jgi:hypothetical protein
MRHCELPHPDDSRKIVRVSRLDTLSPWRSVGMHPWIRDTPGNSAPPLDGA